MLMRALCTFSRDGAVLGARLWRQLERRTQV